MISIEKKSSCSGCYACAISCPQKCIQMISDEEGFWYPRVDKGKCINCNLCEKSCPIINKWQPKDLSTTTAIAAKNRDEIIRFRSSSGGIFTLIAEEILAQDGVVFGAAFSDDFRSVRHICVDNTDDLEKLRGSKYLQSKIGDTYKQAKDFLENGRKVLFTGTPCQIGGLYSYLRKSYDNLFTQDIICHGVPSQMIWNKYVNYREKNSGSTTRRVYFRNKKYGWKNYSVLFDFSNSTKYQINFQNDAYMEGFLRNIYLRPSCYSCAFKTIQRQADITLADFWGIEYVAKDMDDDKGVSLVLIHSEKGKDIFNIIKEQIDFREVSCDKSIMKNTAAINSCSIYPKRQKFYKDIQKFDFEAVIIKHTKLTFFQKARKVLSLVKHKIIK